MKFLTLIDVNERLICGGKKPALSLYLNMMPTQSTASQKTANEFRREKNVFRSTYVIDDVRGDVDVELVSEFVEHLTELDLEIFQLFHESCLVLAHLVTRIHLQRRLHVLELTLHLHYPRLDLRVIAATVRSLTRRVSAFWELQQRIAADSERTDWSGPLSPLTGDLWWRHGVVVASLV